ncbi:MAG: hypothetical protein EA350_09455 [Gemmatimonadales bacterium]|nr:MAG: hypothetical protein EA350_09455 [Gemmatimonadales bacterium]
MSAPLTSIGGLASGIDFPALTDAIMTSRAAPIRKLEGRIEANQARSEAYLSLEARLMGLKAAAGELDRARSLVGMRGQVEPGAGFSVSAGASATAGAFDVTVLELARPERLGGGTFGSRSTGLGLDGTLSFGGVPMEVSAGDSLDAVVARINGLQGTGVRASVITLGPGAHRLVLSSQTEGAQGIDMEDPDQLLAGLGVLDAGGNRVEVLQAGSDARIRVDGVEVTRSSNVMSDVVDGLTFTLTEARPENVSRLTVNRDTAALGEAVEAFVEAYNSATGFIRSQTRSSAAERAPLAGDSVMRALGSGLQSAMLGLAGDSTLGGPARLADIGVTLQLDGSFSVDATRLAAAIASDAEGVARLFTTRSASSDPAVEFIRTSPETEAGSYTVEITAAASAASVQGTPVGGPIVGVGAGDSLTVRSVSGATSVEIMLEEGEDLATLSDRVTLALVGAGLEIEAVVEGGALVLRHAFSGSGNGFQLETGGNAGALLGLAAGTFHGTNVQGTVNGQAARGTGEVLQVTGEGPARGLFLRIREMPAGGSAEVELSRGVGSAVERLTALATGSGNSGMPATRDRLADTSTKLRRRAEDIQARLDLQRAQLLKRFAAVEEAISRAQSQGTYLSSQLDQISNFQYGPRRR